MVSPPTSGTVEHVEDRPERGRLEEGDVGVPPVGPVLAAVDGQHLGVLLDGRDDRVAFGDHAELAGEVRLLAGVSSWSRKKTT